MPRITAVLAGAFIIALLLMGCAAPAESITPEPTFDSEPTPAVTGTPVPTESPAPTDTPEPTEVTVTDMAGREVTISAEIESVFGANNTATVLLYTLVPDRLIGWNITFSDEAKAYMIPEAAALPVLGNLYGSGKMAEAEEVLTYEPDVIIMANTAVNSKLISAADGLQQKMGVPVLVVAASMDNYDEAYAFLGEVFTEQERAGALGGYAAGLVADITEKAGALTEEDKIPVYYARMDDGLTTEFAGSPNAEVLEMAGGVNVAQIKGGETAGVVTLEQIMVWNPAVILVGNIGASETGAYAAITGSGQWEGIDAVAEGRVLKTPQYPFNWFDRPPTVNRLIGLVWLAETLYPDLYDYDLIAETQAFFSLFYGVDLTAGQAAEVMMTTE